MKCLLCGGDLILRGLSDDIRELDTYALVTRECIHCHQVWVLKYVGRSIVSVSEEKVENQDFGFDYNCPHCKFQCYVATTFRPKTGWNCLGCGGSIPNESLIPRGNYQLPEITAYRSSTSPGSKRTRRQGQGASTYQRAPRTSRPIPAGAVSLSTLAERLKVEPRKLRSWLRKVNWRKVDEAGSSWVFSEAEAEEVAKNFGR